MMLQHLLPLLAAHTHYCPEHDRRWVCDRDPCLLHHAAPCPDTPHEGRW